MKILVSGAQGFIGRALIDALAAKHDVYAICRRGAEFSRRNIHVVTCDLSTPSEFRALPSNVDHVVHLAQSSRYREWPESKAAADVFAVNVQATQLLLIYAQQAGARQFVHASTGSVYSPSILPQSEETPIYPAGFYAATKFAAELIARQYESLFSICTLRLFYPYGPQQNGRLISDLIDRVSGGRPITLQGSPDGLLFNPTYLDDVIAVFDAAIDALWQGVINVASPDTISLREAGTIIGIELEKEPLFEVAGNARPNSIIPQLEVLRRHLPLSRFRTFADGIRATINSNRTNTRRNS